jgi:hypothetical protein
MKIVIAQDNRLTSSRYELTLIENEFLLYSERSPKAANNTGQKSL